MTLKFAGNVPVDSSVLESSSGPNNYKIYSEGGVYYDCMLNQASFRFWAFSTLFDMLLIS